MHKSTAREHIEAAWEAAYPVPDGRHIPAGTPVMWRNPVGDHRIVFVPEGYLFGTNGSGKYIRTVEPLPPLIPDNCNAIWASTSDDTNRSVWVRITGSTAGFVDLWDNGNRDTAYAKIADLINPVPIPKEGDHGES